MFTSTFTYRVDVTTRMPEIFPNGLPVNAFIDKGRCAIGGTTQEIRDKSRCTILIVPNTSILKNKFTSEKVDERPDYIVYGDISYPQVQNMFKDRRPGLKIMSTPEGIWKIIKAAEAEGKLTELYKEWLLLLDESHTFISELYRKNILMPFKYFWNFKNKSIISATPYYFSDQRFYDLEHHKITFNETLGKVTLVNAVSVVGTLNYLLKNIHEFPGNVHIFYNSVTEIRNAVLNAELTDCNIFCADDNDKENMKKLGDLVKFFVPEPSSKNYKKINFYTCKYFEGWDLHDDNSTMVLVTDCYKEHTKIGVASKGKQAIGRLRSKPYQIIHITNHEHKPSMIPIEVFKKAYNRDAEVLISNNNKFVMESETGKYKGDHRLEHFANIEKVSKLATLNPNKLDQQINEAANNEIYKHIKFILEDWRKAYFDVEVQHSSVKLETKTEQNRKSSSQRLKEDYEELETIQAKETIVFEFGKGAEQRVIERNPLAYKAFRLLEREILEKHKFNVKKVEQEVILKENIEAEEKLRKLLKKTFTAKKGKDFYTNTYITTTLQELYKKVGLIDPKTGDIKKAAPSDLGSEGRFIVEKTKRTIAKGKREYGLVVKGHQLGLKTTD